MCRMKHTSLDSLSCSTGLVIESQVLIEAERDQERDYNEEGLSPYDHHVAAISRLHARGGDSTMITEETEPNTQWR